MSPRDRTVMRTALALIGAGIIALATDFYLKVTLVVVAYTVSAVMLARTYPDEAVCAVTYPQVE